MPFARITILTTLAATMLTHAAARECSGQVRVQQPTFRAFGVSASVLVPDRGSVYLGGVSSSQRGGSSFGAPIPGLGNRSYGGSTSTGGVSISATIIDHRELDRAILAEAARRRGATVDVLGRPVPATVNEDYWDAWHPAAAQVTAARLRRETSVQIQPQTEPTATSKPNWRKLWNGGR